MNKTSRSLCLFAILIYCITVTGCAMQRGIVTTQCNGNDATLLKSVLLKRSSNEQTVRFQPTTSSSTCIELRRDALKSGVDNSSDTMTIRLGAEPSLQAFNGGGYTTEISFPESAWQNNRISMRKRSDGRASAVQITNPWSDLTLDIWENGRVVPDPDPREVETISLPDIECSGRIRGFTPLTEFGDSPALHPALPRPQVAVFCTAYWLVNMRVGGSNLVKVTTSFTTSDDSGQYSITIAGIDVEAFKSDQPPRLLAVSPQCLIPAQCGHEARTHPDQTLVNTELDDTPDSVNVDILDVLDVVSQGPALPTVDGLQGPRLMLGARLISKATSMPERNDRPFIIHEQIDVFNEEHTRFVVWGFSGQPYRETFTDDEGKNRRIDAATQPCEIVSEKQLCLNFEADCNPNTCQDPDRGCLEYPMLQAMLDAGYDVWIVDHLRGQEDITHLAAGAPLLYQRILNYGGPSGSLGAIPALDELKLQTFSHKPETATPEDAWAAFEHHTLLAEPPAIPPIPMSGDRRAIVSGFSLGGVVARAGLRLWEVEASLPHPQLVDQKGAEVTLARAADVFMEQPGAKIALYVSLDAPHRGARIPVALQAYIKRFKAVADTFASVSEADKLPVTRAEFELSATSTRQILEQEVAFSVGEPLGCFKTGSNPDLNNCRVQPFNTNIKTRVGSEVSGGFESRWLDRISEVTPQTQDGLPISIPSIAISNGAIGGPRLLEQAQIVDLQFDINNAFDKTQRICDEFDETANQGVDIFGIKLCGMTAAQPSGSQWNNVCRRIRDTSLSIEADAWNGSSVGDFFKSLVVWPYVKLIGANIRGIKVTYPMQPEFDANGQQKVNTGFPTIVRTESSLLMDERGRLAPLWRDAFWQRRPEYHSNVDNQICRMILFHADGVFEDDQDGWPACGENINIALCRDGGRFPGRMLGAQALNPNRAPCDCQPNDPRSFPGAAERFGDGIDNDCDGLIDESVVDQ